MRIINTVWDKGDGLDNEDIANHVGNFAWVLDGATAVIKHPTFTPRWLVETADQVLSEGATLCQSLNELLTYYKHNFPQDAACQALNPEQRPSFAGAMIHVHGTQLESLHLADCYTVVKQNDAITVLRDEDYATRSKHDAPTLQKGFYELPADEKTKLMIQRRRTMNTPTGYWVGTADGTAFDHVRTEKYHISPGSEIILCSDGFEAAVEAKLYAWPEIFTDNLQHVVARLRNMEKSSEFVAQNVLRMKKSDDATAIRLVI